VTKLSGLLVQKKNTRRQTVQRSHHRKVCYGAIATHSLASATNFEVSLLLFFQLLCASTNHSNRELGWGGQRKVDSRWPCHVSTNCAHTVRVRNGFREKRNVVSKNSIGRQNPCIPNANERIGTYPSRRRTKLVQNCVGTNSNRDFSFPYVTYRKGTARAFTHAHTTTDTRA